MKRGPFGPQSLLAWIHPLVITVKFPELPIKSRQGVIADAILEVVVVDPLDFLVHHRAEFLPRDENPMPIVRILGRDNGMTRKQAIEDCPMSGPHDQTTLVVIVLNG